MLCSHSFFLVCTGSNESKCPVCHDVSNLCVMLCCAHQLCYACSQLLLDRIPHAIPVGKRAIRCPICRASCPITQIAYVDTRPRYRNDVCGDDDAGIKIKGSYSTKVSISKFFSQSCNYCTVFDVPCDSVVAGCGVLLSDLGVRRFWSEPTR